MYVNAWYDDIFDAIKKGRDLIQPQPAPTPPAPNIVVETPDPMKYLLPIGVGLGGLFVIMLLSRKTSKR